MPSREAAGTTAGFADRASNDIGLRELRCDGADAGAEMISNCYADAMDDQFQQICSGSTLPSQSVRQLVQSGFVVVPGPLTGDRFDELTAAYDEVMAAATGSDFKIASTTTRTSDLLNYASVFD